VQVAGTGHDCYGDEASNEGKVEDPQGNLDDYGSVGDKADDQGADDGVDDRGREDADGGAVCMGNGADEAGEVGGEHGEADDGGEELGEADDEEEFGVIRVGAHALGHEVWGEVCHGCRGVERWRMMMGEEDDGEWWVGCGN